MADVKEETVEKAKSLIGTATMWSSYDGYLTMSHAVLRTVFMVISIQGNWMSPGTGESK